MRSLKALLILSLFAVGAGCSKSSSYDQPIEGRATRGGSYAQLAPQVDPVTGKSVPVSTSYVVSPTNDQNQFQNMISELVRPQIDPKYVGRVNLQTGIVMEAFVALNKINGAVIPSQSRVVLQILDEYVGTKDPESGATINPITMILPGTNGTYTSGGVRMTFSDCAGSIEIQGGVSGAQFSGNVFFTNSRSADCKTTLPGAGTRHFLGTFTVPACGFMTCQ